MTNECGECGFEQRGQRPWHTAWCGSATEADWPAVIRGKKPKGRPPLTKTTSSKDGISL